MAGYDTEWQAAMHLLRSALLADTAALFINPHKREIDWDALRGKVHASSERLFAEVAFALWRGTGSDTARAVNLLSDRNWRRFLEALQLARGERPDLATHPGGWRVTPTPGGPQGGRWS
jgi:hypothetical protein